MQWRGLTGGGMPAGVPTGCRSLLQARRGTGPGAYLTARGGPDGPGCQIYPAE